MSEFPEVSPEILIGMFLDRISVDVAEIAAYKAAGREAEAPFAWSALATLSCYFQFNGEIGLLQEHRDAIQEALAKLHMKAIFTDRPDKQTIEAEVQLSPEVNLQALVDRYVAEYGHPFPLDEQEAIA